MGIADGFQFDSPLDFVGFGVGGSGIMEMLWCLDCVLLLMAVGAASRLDETPSTGYYSDSQPAAE